MRAKTVLFSLMSFGLLSACGKDFNGFGEYQGWGGYTKGYGDVEGYGNKQVGLCSYTGGCMPEEKEDDSVGANSYKRTRDAGSGDTGGGDASE